MKFVKLYVEIIPTTMAYFDYDTIKGLLDFDCEISLTYKETAIDYFGFEYEAECHEFLTKDNHYILTTCEYDPIGILEYLEDYNKFGLNIHHVLELWEKMHFQYNFYTRMRLTDKNDTVTINKFLQIVGVLCEITKGYVVVEHHHLTDVMDVGLYDAKLWQDRVRYL